MNNEPVAWRTHYPSGWEYKDGNPPFELKGNSQLLYTHPAKTLEPLGEKFEKVLNDNLWELMEESPAKTLTDEEIEIIAYKVFELSDGKEALFEFARAILRKAQEK